MDVRLTRSQITYLYDAERKAKTNKYTTINGVYHFSWQANNNIVVGVGGGPGNHRNFTCNITSQFAITVTQAGGTLPVGPAGINATTLAEKVTSALRDRLKKAITEDPAFNDIGRSGQKVEFHKNHIVNRHDTRKLIIGPGQPVNGGGEKTIVNGTVKGLAIYQLTGGNDLYYRNYDIREEVDLEYEEPLRVLHEAGDKVKLLGTHNGEINLVLLD